MIRNKKSQMTQLLTAIAAITISSSALAQTAPPPNLGQETKGQPAVEEAASATDTDQNAPAVAVEKTTEQTTAKKTVKSGGPLGTATIKESRRENGQVYLIELEHSSGAKQYIEETDSDGSIESTLDGLDETPNLPKWKLGSW